LAHLFLGQQEEAGPPALEFEEALDFGVDVLGLIATIGPRQIKERTATK